MGRCHTAACHLSNPSFLPQRTFSRVFDLESSDLDDESVSTPFEGRFPINVGITGFVSGTGQTVNIKDAYEDARFDQAVDR